LYLYHPTVLIKDPLGHQNHQIFKRQAEEFTCREEAGLIKELQTKDGRIHHIIFCQKQS
jgi:hypothetical protein